MGTSAPRASERGSCTRAWNGTPYSLAMQRDGVGADFVDDIAVLRHTIGADDYRVDFALRHHLRDRAIGDQRHWHARLRQFPRGQARALQVGPGLGGDHARILCPALCSTRATATNSPLTLQCVSTRAGFGKIAAARLARALRARG